MQFLFRSRGAQNLGKKPLNLPSGSPNSGFNLQGAEYEKHLDVIVKRLSYTPESVDAIKYILERIIENPKDNRRKQINRTKSIFDKTIGKSEEWGVRLLTAAGFVLNSSGEYYNLRKANLGKLRIVVQKLKEAQETSVYKLALDKIAFSKEAEKLLNDCSEAESLRKVEYFKNNVAEPKDGAAGTTRVRIYFGNADINRRFASDNVLGTVLNWICSQLHTSLVDKLYSGEYELIDRTVYPAKPVVLKKKEEKRPKSIESELDLLDLIEDMEPITKNEDKTLQALGIWPSGELEIQPSGFWQRERALIGIKS